VQRYSGEVIIPSSYLITTSFKEFTKPLHTVNAKSVLHTKIPAVSTKFCTALLLTIPWNRSLTMKHASHERVPIIEVASLDLCLYNFYSLDY